jgi:hypothetical protein
MEDSMLGRRKPDLIVPIRDRRQRKRYLTLKNFGKLMLALLAVFTVITVRSEMRDPDHASYGRLVNRELPSPVQPKPVEVVHEQAPAVDDSTRADPMLTTPAAREQYLHAGTNVVGGPLAAPLPAPALASVEPLPRAEASVATGQTRVAIVGGIDGVQVVHQTRRRPVLSGGFGK